MQLACHQRKSREKKGTRDVQASTPPPTMESHWRIASCSDVPGSAYLLEWGRIPFPARVHLIKSAQFIRPCTAGNMTAPYKHRYRA